MGHFHYPRPTGARHHHRQPEKANQNGQNGQDEDGQRPIHPIVKLVDKWLPQDGTIRSFAKYCPLIAATFAPFSTLMDIPALSERWYYIDGVVQKDWAACIALSAIGLGLNVIANILLIVRFSASSPVWSKYATMLSTTFWMGKTAVAVLNLAIFGTLISRKPGYSFSEAFWCAVVSVIIAGIIAFSLVFHYMLGYDITEEENPMDSIDVRMEGKKFMLSVTVFMVILGFQALAFSQLEGWSYSDAIYFSTQTALTIGYGDLLPTNAASKVLVFCFSVLTISQLGNEIALIISFMSARAEVRRDKWRQRYEGAMHREANSLRPKATLLEEMSLIYEINSREELMNQLVDLIWSAISLVVFWVVGATIFSELEGWSYGNAIYAVMVLSLTIGFGDYTPETAAGRVVFIAYALMAVPIVTSFAVQTITGLLSTYSNRGEIRDRFLRDRKRNPQAFIAHADHILHAHESYGQMRARLLGEEERIDPDKVDPGFADRKAKMMAAEPTQGSDSTAVDDRDRDENGTDSSPSHEKEHKRMREYLVPVNRHAADEAGGRKFGNRLTIPTLHHEGWRDFIRSEKHRVEADAKAGVKAPLTEVEKMVQDAHQEVEGIIQRRRSRSDVHHVPDDHASEQEILDDEHQTQKLESGLLRNVMELIIQLEAEARQMLLDSMDKGVARTLLLADRNVQQRDVRAIRGDEADMISIWQGESDKTDKFRHENPSVSPGLDMLSQVSRYRNTFASVLVVGSILQKLSGDDLNRFERWRGQTPVSASPQRMSLESTGPQGAGESRAGGAEMKRTVRPSGQNSTLAEMGRDVERLAEDNFSGITRLMFRQHTRQLRKSSTDDGHSKKINAE